MKRILVSILVLAALLSSCLALASCDFKQELSNIGSAIKEGSVYDYAIVSFPTGYTKKVELKSYLLDLNNTGLMYVYGRDGSGYMLAPENCMLVNDPNVDINARSSLFDTYKIDYDKVIIKSPNGEIITIEKPGQESIGSIFDLYMDENGTHYYADKRNTIVEFFYE